MAIKKIIPSQLRLIIWWLSFLLLIHLLLRIIFWHHNRSLFLQENVMEKIRIYWWGIQMDLSAIAWINIPFFILYFGLSYLPKYRKAMKWIILLFCIIPNMAGLALNIIDVGYYPFSKHRTNTDLIYVMVDSLGSWRNLVTHYWGLWLLLIAASTALVFIANKILLPKYIETTWKIRLAGQALAMVLLIFFARGWQARPLIPASPLLQIDTRQLPLAQNSTGSFLYSLVRKQEQLILKKYFPPDSLNQLVLSQQFCCMEPGRADSMITKNVMICILESFSSYYLEPGPRRARTPFFDSLMKKSIYFPNAYANAFTSNQGIVAILGGLPNFLDEPFYYSAYANTPLYGIGNILKKRGYSTHFFMGTGEDHFGFEKFGRMAGIDHFHGRREFHDDHYYDGNWGIFDGPFLQFGASLLASQPQPFFAVFFNISSHPPFTIPGEENSRFNQPDQHPAQRSISYVDDAFRLFFSSCQKSSWFKKTIFVFCADHYLYSDDGATTNPLLASQIPLFIYDPGLDSGRYMPTLISQVDITPTILHLLHYEGFYSGFGKDVFDSSLGENYAVNKYGSTYQIISREYSLGYDPIRDQTVFLYNHKTDSALSNNIKDSVSQSSIKIKMQKHLQAVLQRYNQSLLNRDLATP